jgi:hypothetical protein
MSSTLLPEPMEFVDLMPGQSMTLRVQNYKDGTAVIHPRNPTARHIRQHMSQYGLTEAPASGTPISVAVPVLRLYGERLDEFSPTKYWDFSSKTLRADLLARFQAGLALPMLLTITAHGHAPLKRYSVEVGRA